MENKILNDSAIKSVAVKCVKCHKKVAPENAQQTENGYVCNECMPECVKCQKHAMREDGKDTKKGFVCPECLAKTKRNRMMALALLLLCGIIVATVWYFNSDSNKKATATGFDSITEINDSVNVKIDSVDVEFNLSTATLTSTAVSTQAPVSNIAEFKRVLNQNIETAKAENKNSLNIPTTAIMFGFKSAQLSADAYNLIREFASLYNKTSKANTILIDGYACNIGEDAPNDYISQQRAENVKSALIENGVDASKITVRWYGKSKNYEFNLSKNEDYRRVLINIK